MGRRVQLERSVFGEPPVLASSPPPPLVTQLLVAANDPRNDRIASQIVGQPSGRNPPSNLPRVVIHNAAERGTPISDPRFGQLWELISSELSRSSKLGLTLVEVQPGKSLPNRFHRQHDKMFLILEGAGSVRVGEQVVQVKQGDAVAIPRGSIHGVQAAAHPLRMLSINDFGAWPVGDDFGADAAKAAPAPLPANAHLVARAEGSPAFMRPFGRVFDLRTQNVALAPGGAVLQLRGDGLTDSIKSKNEIGYYVLSGSGTIHFGDRKHHLAPGHTIHLPAGERHRLHAESKGMSVVVMSSPGLDLAATY